MTNFAIKLLNLIDAARNYVGIFLWFIYMIGVVFYDSLYPFLIGSFSCMTMILIVFLKWDKKLLVKLLKKAAPMRKFYFGDVVALDREAIAECEKLKIVLSGDHDYFNTISNTLFIVQGYSDEYGSYLCKIKKYDRSSLYDFDPRILKLVRSVKTTDERFLDEL